MFSGSIVAIVTPFKAGKVDEPNLRELVEFHIANGTSGIVPCGTTGESPTLNYEEHARVIEIVVAQTKRRIPVIAGTGSNSTTETVEMTRHAQSVGADAALLVVPYYNRPTQKGLYHHFRHVAESVNLPLILYNIPGRTGTNMLPETIVQLAKECKNIVGVKEASGVMDQVSELVRSLGAEFDVLSGDDAMTLPMLSVGGKGIISVIANIIPKDMVTLCTAWFKGDTKNAREIHLKMFSLVKSLFIETNPIPVKTAMGILGLCSPDLRLPLCPMEDKNRVKLEQSMHDYGLKW